MGNTFIGGRRTTKVMKMDGETLKLRTPVRAGEVVKNHPGLVVIDSRAVRLHGVGAKPLEASHNLDPNRVYFLVHLPNNVNDHGNDNVGTGTSASASASTRSMGPRRVRSGINMSAKDRLESLMLARRSVSDLSVSRPESGTMRVRVRLPKAEVERLLRESKNEADAAEKIVEMCTKANNRGVAAGREQKRVSFMTDIEDVSNK